MASILTNDGEELLLEVLFRGGALPGTYQVGLTDFALVVGSTLADAASAEPAAAFGYARVTITQDNNGTTGWPTSALDGGHWKITAAPVTWTAAGGDIGPFSKVFLTDGAIVVGFWDVLATSIVDGNSFTFTPSIKETSA